MIYTRQSLDISAQVEAARQSQRATFRTSFTGCPKCFRPLPIDEEIERHCIPCGEDITPKLFHEGRAAS